MEEEEEGAGLRGGAGGGGGGGATSAGGGGGGASSPSEIYNQLENSASPFSRNRVDAIYQVFFCFVFFKIGRKIKKGIGTIT